MRAKKCAVRVRTTWWPNVCVCENERLSVYAQLSTRRPRQRMCRADDVRWTNKQNWYLFDWLAGWLKQPRPFRRRQWREPATTSTTTQPVTTIIIKSRIVPREWFDFCYLKLIVDDIGDDATTSKIPSTMSTKWHQAAATVAAPLTAKCILNRKCLIFAWARCTHMLWARIFHTLAQFAQTVRTHRTNLHF